MSTVIVSFLALIHFPVGRNSNGYDLIFFINYVTFVAENEVRLETGKTIMFFD